jgi:hypothetical protein
MRKTLTTLVTAGTIATASMAMVGAANAQGVGNWHVGGDYYAPTYSYGYVAPGYGYGYGPVYNYGSVPAYTYGYSYYRPYVYAPYQAYEPY